MKRKTKILRLVMLCMLMLFSASEMWATEMTVDVKCEPTGIAKVYAKFETETEYTENQKTVLNPENSGNYNLKYDNLQEGYTFLGWSKGAPSTNASDMVSTDQEATVTVLSSEPTVTYYANFADGSKFKITEDASISEHGTVTYKVNGTETAPVSGVINAKENDEITLIVTPNTGWIVDVDNVKAESYTTWDAAGARRRSAPDNIQILGDVTLTKSTTAENTWTFTMPAASVLVSAAYIPVAAFAPAEPSGTLAPTAAEGVIAGEDKAIIVAGTVANIPETTNPQGTVKYFVTDNKDMTAEQAAKANGWVETLPTAAGYTGSYADDFQVYVWYYIQAATGYADSEPQRIEVTVQSNLFDLAFMAANANTIESGKATVTVGGTAATVTEGKLEGVKMGSEVKLEAKPGYKFRKVEVKKVDPAKAYLKWNSTQKKLVATEMPATYNTVENASTNVNWQAGTYVVEGNVTINARIRLYGNVDLIIKDGAKLTVNSYINGDDKNLRIFGQAQMTGELVVNCSGPNDQAISQVPTLEVHSAKVTATSSANTRGGFINIGTFNVYGGLVDAKNTGSSGFGIRMNSGGSMNIYGGEVKAEGKGNGTLTGCGFAGDDSYNKTTVTVYGGKIWSGSAEKTAFINVNLQKGAGFTGKIETSADNSDWAEYTGDETPDSKYVRVGY